MIYDILYLIKFYSHVPVVQDLAQTVKMGSDHYENLTNDFDGANNGKKIPS